MKNDNIVVLEVICPSKLMSCVEFTPSQKNKQAVLLKGTHQILAPGTSKGLFIFFQSFFLNLSSFKLLEQIHLFFGNLLLDDTISTFNYLPDIFVFNS